jgi:hypothetical protein
MLHRPEIIAWILVHGAGLLINIWGVLLIIPLAKGRGPRDREIVRGIQHVICITIHASSLFTGTVVIENLETSVVWTYALYQGLAFVVGIGFSNVYLSLKEARSK